MQSNWWRPWAETKVFSWFYAFMHIFEIPPYLSEAKIREGILTGPQIRDLLRNETFERKMNITEKAAWKSFREVVTKFLSKKSTPKWEARGLTKIKHPKGIGNFPRPRRRFWVTLRARTELNIKFQLGLSKHKHCAWKTLLHSIITLGINFRRIKNLQNTHSMILRIPYKRVTIWLCLRRPTHKSYLVRDKVLWSN